VSDDSSGEKRFDPTPKRKADAAQKGDTLRSKEAAVAAAMATGTFMLSMIGPWLFESLKSVALSSFRLDQSSAGDFTPGTHLANAAGAMLPPIFSIGMAVMIITVGSQMLLGEGRWVPTNLKPKGSRVNPLSGLKRIFGTQGLIELFKSVLKLALMGSIAWYWITGNLAHLLGMGRSTLSAQLDYAWDAAGTLVAMLIVGLLIIAMIDYPLQRYQRNKRLKMSMQDMKDEGKQTEASPEVKMARRQRQRDLARGSVGTAMQEAQFVVVNPMHFAVALKYDPDLAPAPIVLAKGRGETAMAMREMASEQDLPVLHYPQLARALYFTTRANQMVREELYVAIASLVAFVLSLKRGENPVRPQVDVPEELRFDADGNAPDHVKTAAKKPA